jgi:hypothetical protein
MSVDDFKIVVNSNNDFNNLATNNNNIDYCFNFPAVGKEGAFYELRFIHLLEVIMM